MRKVIVSRKNMSRATLSSDDILVHAMYGSEHARGLESLEKSASAKLYRSSSSSSKEETASTYDKQIKDSEHDKPSDGVEDTEEVKQMLRRHLIYSVLLPICAVAFFRAFKPAEPFLTNYLVDVKHFSLDDVNNAIYPVFTYANLVFLVLVAFLTDVVGYVFMIMVELLCQVATYALLIWTSSLTMMKIMQIAFGLAMASQASFQNYPYCLVEERYFTAVTSATRAAMLLGHSIAEITGQLLYSYANVSFQTLFLVSFGALCLSLLIALIWMPTRHGNNRRIEVIRRKPSNKTSTSPSKIISASYWKELFGELFKAYSTKKIVFWSLVYALNDANMNNLQNYGTSVWYSIDNVNVYNGYITAVSRLVGVLAAILPSYMETGNDLGKPMSSLATSFVVLFPLICGVLILLTPIINTLWFAYLSYCLCVGMLQFVWVITDARVSRAVKEIGSEKYALIGGMNMFASLLLQTILQIIASDAVLNISIHTRMFIIAAMNGFLFIVCFFALWLC